MKIAVFSDVHANLPALQAVIADIQKQQPDEIYCLGDLVNFAPWPNEVIKLIRDQNIPTLCGNHDLAIGLGHNEFPFSWHSPEEHQAGLKAIEYTNAILTDENRNYLQALPKFIRPDIRPVSDAHLLLTHGSPRSVGEYVFEDFAEDVLLKIMDDYVTDILVMGHTHRPYHRQFLEGKRYKHAINVGSVGKPKDGDSRAAYIILTLQAGLTMSGPKHLPGKTGIIVEIKRVEYDIQKTREAILKSRIPNLYADQLINA